MALFAVNTPTATATPTAAAAIIGAGGRGGILALVSGILGNISGKGTVAPVLVFVRDWILDIDLVAAGIVEALPLVVGAELVGNRAVGS